MAAVNALRISEPKSINSRHSLAVVSMGREGNKSFLGGVVLSLVPVGGLHPPTVGSGDLCMYVLWSKFAWTSRGAV